jgi:WhiB family redox-sensing transcriptional regulator
MAVPAMTNRRSLPSDTPPWQFHAACRGEDASLFFAPGYFERREEKARREAKAKAICARCPVRVDCLDYALRIKEPHGVWGGMNEQERRILLREQARRVG